MQRIANIGPNAALYCYRSLPCSLRQRFFGSTLAPGGLEPEDDSPLSNEPDTDTDAGLDADTAAAVAKTEDPLPRHRNFTMPHPATLNTELGRQIGYDYAVAGLQPPAEAPLAFQEGFGSGRRKLWKPKPNQQVERKLLRLRYSAWRRNRLFDSTITPDFLQLIARKYCPITRALMTSGTGQETDASVERLYNGAAYAIGNILFMSAKANWAKANRSLDDLVTVAEDATDLEALPAACWARLAALSNMFQPDVSRLCLMPMHVYPPANILINNPSVMLQEAVSLAAGGWESQQLHITLRNATNGKVQKRSLDQLVDLLRGALAREMRSSRQLTLAWTVENAWQAPAVFDLFVKWYAGLSPTAVRQMVDVTTRARPHIIARVTEDSLDAWGIATRGYDREGWPVDDVCERAQRVSRSLSA